MVQEEVIFFSHETSRAIEVEEWKQALKRHAGILIPFNYHVLYIGVMTQGFFLLKPV